MNAPKPPSTTGLDRVAVFLSGLCMVHCLAIPFAVLLGPFLSQWMVERDTLVHWLLLGLALPISVIALRRGFVRHRNALTLGLGVTGLTLMFVGVAHFFGEAWEIGLTVVGVSALMLAHIRNMLAGHRHG